MLKFFETVKRMSEDTKVKGVRMQKTSYIQTYRGCSYTVTIERGDKMNKSERGC